MTPNVKEVGKKYRPAAHLSERAFVAGARPGQGERVREGILKVRGLNTIYFHMIYQKGLSKRPIVSYLDPIRRLFCFGQPVQCLYVVSKEYLK